MNRVLIDVIL